jgi:response regulator of citrate/malate metabolism
MKLTKQELTHMYQTMGTVEIAENLGISRTTLYKYLRFFKIKLRGPGKNRVGKTKIKLEK